MGSWLYSFKTIFYLDLRAEIRNRRTLGGVLYFSVLTSVVVSFSSAFTGVNSYTVFPVAYFITLLFASSLYLSRSFQREIEGNMGDVIAISPGDKSFLFLARCVSSAVFLSLIAFVQLVVFNFLMPVSAGVSFFTMCAVTFLFIMGMCFGGVLFGSAMYKNRAREILTPLLIFPINLPPLFASLKLFQMILIEETVFQGPWLSILIGFDVISAVLGIMFFGVLVSGAGE